MKRLSILAALAATTLALTACSGDDSDTAASDGESYAWDMSVTTGETSSWYLGATRFAEILEERSDGRIVVSVFANDTLSAGDALVGVEQLTNGDKALAYNSAIQLSGLDDRFSAIAAPFTFSSYDQVDSVIGDPEVVEAYSELAGELNAKLLGFGENGFRQISTTSHEIQTPEDLKGLKIRVAGSPLFLDMYQTLGADPVVMSFAELFTSLQTGAVDGQENSIDNFYANGLSEVQDNLAVMNYVYDPLLLIMNNDVYESLSDTDRELVDEAAAEANEYQIELIREAEKEQLAELDGSIRVNELSESEISAFRDALAGVYDKWEGKWTPELYELIQPE